MTRRGSGVWSLLGTGMRGLRSRLLLTLGSILLAAISVGAAVVGPMYQAGAASSYLVTKLQSEPNFLTGVVFDYRPTLDPEDTYAEQLSSARSLADRELNDQFAPATIATWSQRFNGFPGHDGAANLVSAPGQCAHVHLVGRCPSKVGEALILKQDSTYAPLKIGQSVKLEGLHTPDHHRGDLRTARDRRELTGSTCSDLESVPPQPSGSGDALGAVPSRPAARHSRDVPDDGHGARGSSGRPGGSTVTPETTLADLQRATGAVAALEADQQAVPGRSGRGRSPPSSGTRCWRRQSEVQERRATARSTVAPAVVSVILVALVLLLRLLSAAMELRRSGARARVAPRLLPPADVGARAAGAGPHAGHRHPDRHRRRVT